MYIFCMNGIIFSALWQFELKLLHVLDCCKIPDYDSILTLNTVSVVPQPGCISCTFTTNKNGHPHKYFSLTLHFLCCWNTSLILQLIKVDTHERCWASYSPSSESCQAEGFVGCWNVVWSESPFFGCHSEGHAYLCMTQSAYEKAKEKKNK